MSSRISSNTTILRLVFPPDFFVYDFVFLLYVFVYDVYSSRIFFGYDLVLLPYFFGYVVYFCRISSDTTILRLLFLRIRRVFLPYFLGYDNSTTRISSDTTSYYSCISSDTTILRLLFLPIRPRISAVSLRIRQFFDSYLFPIFFIREFYDLYSSLFLL